jgi:hypothetical protein
MTQVLRKVVTFDEFVAKYPDNTLKRYELYDGLSHSPVLKTGDSGIRQRLQSETV